VENYVSYLSADTAIRYVVRFPSHRYRSISSSRFFIPIGRIEGSPSARSCVSSTPSFPFSATQIFLLADLANNTHEFSSLFTPFPGRPVSLPPSLPPSLSLSLPLSLSLSRARPLIYDGIVPSIYRPKNRESPPPPPPPRRRTSAGEWKAYYELTFVMSGRRIPPSRTPL